MNTLKQEIYEITKKNRITFIELEELFEKYNFDYKGNKPLLALDGTQNLIMWDGWNKEAIELIQSLKELTYIAVNSSINYLICGGGLDLPIAKSIRPYKKPRWLVTDIAHDDLVN